ncbi:hypothetical protein Ga0466249_001077 [Sporomusaceae bacterium BoRhaA]|uniref:hypothetical protein n=1 Tax=Pelorhabdus rhamnosifermentans TaxID=2772457 RepID=UPI001C05F7BC|nr:hypothetical protein [Pelorhabdus rhamnosifermentans]MBU2699985.1 hypothetical protein [Pelorhabdus rhamnosifermentans]
MAQSLTIDELNVLANGLFETKEEEKSTKKLEIDIKALQDQIKCLQRQTDELSK